VINVLVKNREEAGRASKMCLSKFGKTLILIMKVRAFLYLDLKYCRNTSIDKLRSKNFNNSQKNLSTDNFVNPMDDSNKLVDKVDTIGLQDFVKN
jgi:RNA polymerase sigma-70 factor (ECF subfamily)